MPLRLESSICSIGLGFGIQAKSRLVILAMGDSGQISSKGIEPPVPQWVFPPGNGIIGGPAITIGLIDYVKQRCFSTNYSA